MKNEDVNQEVQIQKLMTTLDFVQKDVETLKSDQKSNYDHIIRKLEEINNNHTTLRNDINNNNRLIIEQKIMLEKHSIETDSQIKEIWTVVNAHELRFKKEEWLKSLGKGVLSVLGLGGVGAVILAIKQYLLPE